MKKLRKLAEKEHKERQEYHQKPAMNSLAPSRSSGYNHIKFDSSLTKDQGHKGVAQQPVTIQASEPPLHFHIIQIPKTIVTSPFLQHPSLTPGQKRYLYTVEEAYSKDHVRNLIRQHYLNVLHRSVSTGVSPTRDVSFNTISLLRIPTPDMKHEPEEKSQKKSLDAKANGSKPKTPTSKKAVILPKINSHQKSLLSTSTHSNGRNSRLPLTKRNKASPRSVKWEMDLEKQEPEDNSVLSNISLLSLENQDFLYVT